MKRALAELPGDSTDLAPMHPERPSPHAHESTVIQPGGAWPRIDVKELWEYRGLFVFLVWRDVKVRYAQTVLGAGWAIIQPVLLMVVFSVVFGGFAQIPTDGPPYPLFSLAALVPWTYFSSALTAASNSLVTNSNLITKVYFPRLVVPLAPVLAGLVDFAIGLGILLVMMLVMGYVPTLAALPLLPVLVIIMMLVASGVGCWLAALNVQYRDVKYVVPFLVQVGLYASPVVYPLSIVREKLFARGELYEALYLVYLLNPMVGVIEGFRSTLFGSSAIRPGLIGLSLTTSFLLFISGALYFRHTERVFADVA